MTVSADQGQVEKADTPPTWQAAQQAMRQNVKYAAALEQIMIIVGKSSPAYGVALAALQGR